MRRGLGTDGKGRRQFWQKIASTRFSDLQ